MTPARHFLDIDALDAAGLAVLLELAAEPPVPQLLAGRGVALLFEKPSARTRNSTEMAVVQLGGHPVTMRGEEVGLDTRESVEDVARTLACYHAVIAARVFDHRVLERMTSASDVPIVNLLSDRAHPCQAVADLLTLQERFGHLAGLNVAWIGDFNNVAHSLALALGRAGATLRVACPPGYGPPGYGPPTEPTGIEDVEIAADPRAAAKGADALFTDAWTSMGQEEQAAQRRRAFAAYTITPELMAIAAPHAVFLHCLPAHRGEEVTDTVIDGPASLVWREAFHRVGAARAVLRWVLGEGP